MTREEQNTVDAILSRLGHIEQRLRELEHPPAALERERARLYGAGFRAGYPPRMTPQDRQAEHADGEGWPCEHCGATGRHSMLPFIRGRGGQDPEEWCEYTRLFVCPACGHTTEG